MSSTNKNTRTIEYTVIIRRVKKEKWFESSYNINIVISSSKQRQGILFCNEDYKFEFSEYFRAYTMKQAKRKALKYILSIDRDYSRDIKFGVQFEVSGTVEEMKRRLQ